MTTFATIDRDDHLRVVTIDPGTERHDVIADLGVVTGRRQATMRLHEASYQTCGGWRGTTEHTDIRSLQEADAERGG
jgi:hypothetical protein